EGGRRDQRDRALHLGHRSPPGGRAVPRSGPPRHFRHAGGAMNRRERGGMSIVMLAVLVVGLVLAMGAARLGGALVGRARAESAADAAALAAADRLALGSGAAAARSA